MRFSRFCIYTFTTLHPVHPQLSNPRLSKDTINRLCRGAAYVPQWGRGVHPKDMRKALQLCFHNLGGWQSRMWGLSQVQAGQEESSRCKLAGLSEEEVDAGFDFIQKEFQDGHLSTTENGQLKWITKYVWVKKDSPIYGWPQGLVEKAVKNLTNDGVLALSIKDFWMALSDVDKSMILYVVVDLLKAMKSKAVGLVGQPGGGKTPFARILALMASRFWLSYQDGEPGVDIFGVYREASEFDFFRGECGRQNRPDIYDDGKLADEPVRKAKAFADVGNTTMAKERWGAAKWVRGQWRIFVSNDYIEIAWFAEHADAVAGSVLFMPHADFILCLTPLWPKEAGEADIMAVLKRTWIVLTVHNFVIIRPAGEHKVPVKCMVWKGEPNYLTDAGGKKFLKYKEGELELPNNFKADVEWEQKFVRAVLNGSPLPPLPWTIVGDNPLSAAASAPAHMDFGYRSFGASAPLPSGPSSSAAGGPSFVTPKRERPGFTKSLTGLAGGSIDLDSSPEQQPPQSRVKIEEATVDMPKIKVEPAPSTLASGLLPMGVVDVLDSDEEDLLQRQDAMEQQRLADMAQGDGKDPFAELSQEEGHED